jgi:trimeric autotransporter adhesin
MVVQYGVGFKLFKKLLCMHGKVALSVLGIFCSFTFSSGQIITTIAGNGIAGAVGDGGLATLANLNAPEGIALDDLGNIYISDNLNNKVRKINAKTGIITTVAGNGTGGFSGDGGPATSAELLKPGNIAFDRQGNLYIADLFNQRIRKVSKATGIITTIAGTGASGYTGDKGLATSATLYYPDAVRIDSAGNIYIADELNNAVRKITVSTGIITTVAGTGSSGYTGDGGPATSAKIGCPSDIAFDSSWNMYISDGNNVIRKVDAHTGIITTVVGNGTEGYSGDSASAKASSIDGPVGIAVDAFGNIYIADLDNSRIREVKASTGIITTIIGNGMKGYSGDGGPATKAEIYWPLFMTLDRAGNLYFDDNFNNRVRKVTLSK